MVQLHTLMKLWSISYLIQILLSLSYTALDIKGNNAVRTNDVIAINVNISNKYSSRDKHKTCLTCKYVTCWLWHVTHSWYPGFCNMGLMLEGLGDVGPENGPRYEIKTYSRNRLCQYYSFHNGECSYQQKTLKWYWTGKEQYIIRHDFIAQLSSLQVHGAYCCDDLIIFADVIC